MSCGKIIVKVTFICVNNTDLDTITFQNEIKMILKCKTQLMQI